MLGAPQERFDPRDIDPIERDLHIQDFLCMIERNHPPSMWKNAAVNQIHPKARILLGNYSTWSYETLKKNLWEKFKADPTEEAKQREWSKMSWDFLTEDITTAERRFQEKYALLFPTRDQDIKTLQVRGKLVEGLPSETKTQVAMYIGSKEREVFTRQIDMVVARYKDHPSRGVLAVQSQNLPAEGKADDVKFEKKMEKMMDTLQKRFEKTLAEKVAQNSTPSRPSSPKPLNRSNTKPRYLCGFCETDAHSLRDCKVKPKFGQCWACVRNRPTGHSFKFCNKDKKRNA